MKTTGIIFLSIGLLSLFGGLINPSGAQIEVVITGYFLKFSLIVIGIVLIIKKKPKQECTNSKPSLKISTPLKEMFPEIIEIFPKMKEISNSIDEFVFSIDDKLITNEQPGTFVYNLHVKERDVLLSCSFKDDILSLTVSTELNINIIETSKARKEEMIKYFEELKSNIDLAHTKKRIGYVSNIFNFANLTIRKKNLLTLTESLEIKNQELSNLREKEKEFIEDHHAYIKPYVDKTKFLTSDVPFKFNGEPASIFFNKHLVLSQDLPIRFVKAFLPIYANTSTVHSSKFMKYKNLKVIV